MEALGNAVVAGKAPHPNDLLGPLGQGLAESGGGLEAAAAQGLDDAQQLGDVAKAGGLGLFLQTQEGAEPFLELVDALQGGLLGEEPLEPLPLDRIEPIGSGTRQPEPGAIPAQSRTQLPGQPQQTSRNRPRSSTTACRSIVCIFFLQK